MVTVKRPVKDILEENRIDKDVMVQKAEDYAAAAMQSTPSTSTFPAPGDTATTPTATPTKSRASEVQSPKASEPSASQGKKVCRKIKISWGLRKKVKDSEGFVNLVS